MSLLEELAGGQVEGGHRRTLVEAAYNTDTLFKLNTAQKLFPPFACLCQEQQQPRRIILCPHQA